MLGYPGRLYVFNRPLKWERKAKMWVRLTQWSKKKDIFSAYLVVQCLRICFAMQGPLVPSLVQGDSTCPGATKPMHHNYWCFTLKPGSYDYWAQVSQVSKPVCLEPMLCKRACPTLCYPIDGSPPGPLVPGTLQARTLEWAAISFSNAWKQKVKVKSLSHVWLRDPMDCSLPGSSIHGLFQARVLECGAIAFSLKGAYIYK